ncbi:hypothetical protein PUNSTDRAFT_54777 [Punctularia strigosozonata HHB-11173 SS5]|uniref:uncharacterized protein n=1 Tax=Punctularia strigosozonata (strain HHB-11173) TaxID=741275 RepID=UPI00044167B5|nr:uncharacterized protein PUNSTDRAFT_54777 [Punctularia strigosozonata HHB-11173 SS5]EIN05331.1 hypothetical protein PUNSTDRAFT_54777 [Punctularia strigosozonata HHB-11173 SS5]
MSNFLLPFHKKILEEVHSPETSDLLLLARGLGLRKLVCYLLKIYDSPQSLVLLVNATDEEVGGIGEELGVMGCRRPGLRAVGYEMGKKERQDLYKRGGLICVTSRILVVDMLQGDIPTELITGILVLHAERVTALSLEAFIVRLYRERNTTGFLKAFTDQPEHITSGLSPLKNIMKELQLRRVHIYPRFHQEVQHSLARRRADVIELYQPLTEAMSDIHQAIVQCMTTTLSELKRANTTLDLDDFNIENAYFRSFDLIVRRQLDPVWHKVGPRTKQLVNDLATLRRLLSYLLTYDPLAFHAYLETLIAANSVSASGGPKVNHSPWMLTDAANIIFREAKRRCYTVSAPIGKGKGKPVVIDLADDEDAWDALDEIQGTVGTKLPTADHGKGKEKEGERPAWLPEGMDPVLEELPKWALLAEVLKEVEEEVMRGELKNPQLVSLAPGNNTVLIMTSSSQTSTLLTEFLSSMDIDAPAGRQGRRMMERKLKAYLWWKGRLAEEKSASAKGGPSSRPSTNNRQGSNTVPGTGGTDGLSEALRKKDREREEKRASRRRVRGGAPVNPIKRDEGARDNAAGGSGLGQVDVKNELGVGLGEGQIVKEAEDIAEFLMTQGLRDLSTSDGQSTEMDGQIALAMDDDFQLVLEEDGFDENYGLLPPSQTVIVRAYSDDGDDMMLAEIQPRFIVMFEPNQDFVRRVEVYRSSHPGLAVRVYFMVYQLSCEEHRFLAAQRREKEAFESLIKERGSMLLPIFEERRAATGTTEGLIKTISTRAAGGQQRQVNSEPSRVIVDMREFRSTLPSLLHAANILVVPATLTVGDYILTPDMCVERKSLPDLVQSFTSGRLYTQCELMSVHYKQPILLIEFEEHKSFSLETVTEMKSYAKPTGKYPPKRKPGPGPDQDQPGVTSIQAKLVLLALSFPRVRIIWSSSPYATADIFKDLKLNSAEPDPVKAITVGAEEDPDAGAGVNQAAEELLRCLPGITAKNVKYVMSKVASVRQLCELPLAKVQEILGVEPGKACWEFIHRGEDKRT